MCRALNKMEKLSDVENTYDVENGEEQRKMACE